MERVELTPYQVADSIVHVVITAIFIGFALFAVALKLQAFDQLTATVVNVQADLTFTIFH